MPNVSSFGAQTDNAVVSGTVTDRQMIIPDAPPQGLMSVGPRVTPNFVLPREWNDQTTYHFFDAVRDGKGNAYVATKPVVPAGTPLTDENYWFLWADPDTRFDDINEVIKTLINRVAKVEGDFADIPTLVSNELKNAFGLKAFGAIEGTDASAQIADMIHSLGFVALDGDYLINTVELPNEPIIIFGNNHKLTALKNKQVLFSGASISGQGNNKLIYIENCVFDGGMTDTNAADYSKMAVSSNRCDTVVINNCTFENFAEDSAYIGGVDRAYIEACSFKNIGTYLYQSTRNGFSCFSWYLTANGSTKAGDAGRIISIKNNAFKDITDEGFRIDDFDLTEVCGNHFENIGQYAMEPTYDVTFSTSDKVFNASNNRILNTGSTAISFDLQSNYDQSARKNFKVMISNNEIKGIAKSDRYMKNGSPLAAKLHIVCNFYVTNGMNELTLSNNDIHIDGYTPHAVAAFGNHLTYISNCSKYTFEGNNVSIVNNSAEENASYMCLMRAIKGNYIVNANNFNVDGEIFTLFTADNCDVKLTNNIIKANCQYIAYCKGANNITVQGNNIECEPTQHVFINQTVDNFLMIANIIKQANNSSSRLIVSNLGDVTNTNFMIVNNIVNKASNIAYPTSGFNAQLIENNI